MQDSGALYIHVPYCKRKCNYCDFYSITELDSKKRYFDALLKEITLYSNKPPFELDTINTIYLGGGTPSLLAPEEALVLLNHIKWNFHISGRVEVSFEANPGTVLQNNLFSFLKAGFNRVTIGVQSFQDDELAVLTRIHNAEQAANAVRQARKAGFENIGIDLIFGIPGQTLNSWRQSLQYAIDLHPHHISMYSLTIEPHTPLARAIKNKQLVRCDEELEREMYLKGIDVLESAGYEQYEISNLALQGYRSRHNQKYWNGNSYLGLGPAAHSFNGIERWWNCADVEQYCQYLGKDMLPFEKKEQLSVEQKCQELLLTGLRRKEGMDLQQWASLVSGELLTAAEDIITELGGLDTRTLPFKNSRHNRLLTLVHKHLCLTRQGLLLYDSVCERLSEVI